MPNYLGEDEILREYFVSTGRYKPLLESATRSEGFHSVSIRGERYCVSDLINIAQFTEFMNENHEYRHYS